MRNAVLIVAAVAVLAVGFVFAAGAGDPDGSATSAGTTTTQETAAPAAPTPPTTKSTPEPDHAPKPDPRPAIPTVSFTDGAPRGGVKTLAFDKGEQVRFRVRSDVSEEIHVHGFDEYADVPAGGSVTIAFAARFDGAFEVEMHGSGTPVATLEIQP